MYIQNITVSAGYLLVAYLVIFLRKVFIFAPHCCPTLNVPLHFQPLRKFFVNSAISGNAVELALEVFLPPDAYEGFRSVSQQSSFVVGNQFHPRDGTLSPTQQLAKPVSIGRIHLPMWIHAKPVPTCSTFNRNWIRTGSNPIWVLLVWTQKSARNRIGSTFVSSVDGP